MIIKLNASQQEQLLQYLYQEASFNIFPIGDVEAFGLETDFQKVYAEVDEQGRFLSILLRYREFAIYYADQQRFNLEYLTLFEQDPFKFISGKTELLNLIKPHLIDFDHKHMYFCEALEFPESKKSSVNIKLLTTRDEAERLFDFLVMIEEFGFQHRSKAEFVEKKMNEAMGITLMIEMDGMIVSTVATTAETTINAMVVAVATHPEHRGHGYATLLMQELMNIYLIDKKKYLCLFYDNPKAGHIYHRLGFKTIGTWDTYSRHHDDDRND